MCDAFETGKCPSRIIVTSNAVCFRQFQQYLNDNFIFFETLSFSETDKGILLFSIQDRDDCDTFLKTLYSQAARFGNCFHEFSLSETSDSNKSVPTVCECDSSTS